MRTNKIVLRAILLLVLLVVLVLPLASINAVLAEEDMTSHLICPCECAMIISTCDCSTAVQIKKEISSMKGTGFSDKQIITALQTEYGRDILVYPEKDSVSLLIPGIFLVLVLLILGYIAAKRTNPNIIPDIMSIPYKEKYEQQFEEEYQKFVSEQEDN